MAMGQIAPTMMPGQKPPGVLPCLKQLLASLQDTGGILRDVVAGLDDCNALAKEDSGAAAEPTSVISLLGACQEKGELLEKRARAILASLT